MKVLSDDKYTHIISWLPSGKSFMIHKPKLFATLVLPLEFKQAKHSSFTRKLHRWGFMRHYRGDEAGAFFHEDFQEGRLDMAEHMSCYTGTGEKDQPAAPPDPKQKMTSKPPAAVDAKPTAARKPVLPMVSQKKQPRRPSARASPSTAASNTIREHDIHLPSLPIPTSTAIADIEDAMAINLRKLDNNTLLALQLQQEQAPSSSEGGWADLKALTQIEISRRIMQEKIEQANNARRLALLQQQQQQREAQLQAAEQQERRDMAQLQALLQLHGLHQFQQLAPTHAPTFLPATWQAQPSNSTLNMEDRTLLALAAQNLALVGGAGDDNVVGGGGLNNIMTSKSGENLISYATKRPSLPCTNIEGAKTA